MQSGLHTTPNGAIESEEGWAVSFLSPELLEYRQGHVACLVNVGYSSERNACAIFATESTSLLAPHLRQHLQQAAPLLRGRYVIV
jgi:hypothetical protein